jgi:hypothetical protein
LALKLLPLLDLQIINATKHRLLFPLLRSQPFTYHITLGGLRIKASCKLNAAYRRLLWWKGNIIHLEIILDVHDSVFKETELSDCNMLLK